MHALTAPGRQRITVVRIHGCFVVAYIEACEPPSCKRPVASICAEYTADGVFHEELRVTRSEREIGFQFFER